MNAVPKSEIAEDMTAGNKAIKNGFPPFWMTFLFEPIESFGDIIFEINFECLRSRCLCDLGKGTSLFSAIFLKALQIHLYTESGARESTFRCNLGSF